MSDVKDSSPVVLADQTDCMEMPALGTSQCVQDLAGASLGRGNGCECSHIHWQH